MLTKRAVSAFKAVAVLAVLLIIPGYMVVKTHPQFGNARARQTAVSANPAANTASAERLAENFGKLPLNFEPNVGQTDSRVKFLARAGGYMVFLSPDEAVVEIHSGVKKGNTEAPEIKTAALSMKFAGARTAQVEGAGQLPGRVNYILGNDPSKWHSNVATYSQVKYSNVYPGVDLLFHGNGRQLEYDFVVGPGADVSRIHLQIDGAQSIQVEKSGDTILETKLGGLELKRPVIYQEVSGQRKEVAGGYVLKNSHELVFQVAPYDRKLALVIDPVLQYSTYLGGSSYDYASGLAADATGATYLTGITLSLNFPVMNAFISTNPNGGSTVTAGNYTGFVTKLNPGGTALVYSTYLGGTTPISTNVGAQAQDYPNAIAVDTSGQAYVVGQTFDTNFPVTPLTAFEPTQQAKANSAFVTVFKADGSSPLYSTYMGAELGAISSTAVGVAVDNLGGAYVTGNTDSFNFPVTPGAFQTTFAGQAFSPWVTKFNTLASGVASVVYSSFLGGSGNANGMDDTAFGIAVDASGDAYATGDTVSTDFPVLNGFQLSLLGAENAYVTEINPTGTMLISSTYLGGTGMDGGDAITVDGSGSAYVAGSTNSTDFPVTAGAYQTGLAGVTDVFVTKFAVGGGVSTLSYSTYLGGAGPDTPNAIAVDSLGQAYIGGQTFSGNFPVVNPFQATNANATGSNGFISQLDPTGAMLLFSSYIGGSGNSAIGISGDQVWGVGLDALDNIYLGGQTISTDFPLVNPLSCCLTLGGGEDAFVAEVNTSPITIMPTTLAFGNVIVGVTSPAMNLTVTNGSSATISVTSISITGANAADFAATNNCAIVLAGATCTIPVTFTPSIVGAEAASLQLLTTAPENPGPVALTGTGVPSTPVVTLSPTSLTFPPQTLGSTSPPMSVTLTNNGGSNLIISAITVIGTNAADFAQINNCGTVAPSGSCTITVTFTPSIVGAESATVNIADNAPNSPQTVPLSGTGASGSPQAVLTPTSLTFPSTTLGMTSPAMTVVLSNPGTGPLSITSITTTGTNAPAFAQTNTCGVSLAAGANCTISVTFTPTAPGTNTATLDVTDNAVGSPQTAALTGTGINTGGPSVSLSPASLSFPATAVGTSAPAMNTVLTNTGGSPLTITGIAVTGTNASSFSQTNTCGSTVNAGANCTISVTFTPATSGSLSAAITITDNATPSTQTVTLTGSGSSFSAPVVAPTSLTLTAGQSGTFTATVSSVGGFAGTVTVTCTGMPAASTCIPLPASLMLTSGSSAASTVSVTTTARGSLPPTGGPQTPGGPLTAVPALAMAVLTGMFFAMRRTGRMDAAMGRRLAGIGLASVLLWVGLLAACGGSGGGSITTGTPAGNYTLTVTAVSGGVSLSTPVPLTVQ